MMPRETIYAALWAKVTGIPGLVTASRRLKHWNDVSAEMQPALFQAQAGEVAKPTTSKPTQWDLSVYLHLYVNTAGDPDASPATLLNPLLDAITAALAPDATMKQTLGGLVFDCKINGKIETLEGVLGAQEVALIPIEIQVR